MSARARRIRRQHRKHGKPTFKTINGRRVHVCSLLVRYSFAAYVMSRGQVRLRRIEHRWDEHQDRIWSGVRQRYVFVSKGKL